MEVNSEHLKTWVESKFPLYYKVDSFYAGRSSVDPPALFESGETSTSQLLSSSFRLEEEGEEDLGSLVHHGSIGSGEGSSMDSAWSNYDSPSEEVSIELTQPSAPSADGQTRSVELPPSSEIHLTTGAPPQVTRSSAQACGSATTDRHQRLPSSGVVVSCISATTQAQHQSSGKRTAAETLFDSLAALAGNQLAFQREELSRTLEFKWNILEKMLELENKKLALKMQMHEEEMQAAQQHHDEVMQLRQAKLEATLSTAKTSREVNDSPLE